MGLNAILISVHELAAVSYTHLDVYKRQGQHGTTFGGNPIASAAALEVLSRVAEEKFLLQVREKGEYLRSKLEAIPGITQVRGMGMMLGAQLEKDNAKEVAGACVQYGLLILTAKNVLRLLPPLTISYEEIDLSLIHIYLYEGLAAGL